MDNRVFSLSFRPYELNFKKPVKMARGVMTRRKGVILKLDGEGGPFFSELVPLKHFGSESLARALNFLETLSEVTADGIETIPNSLPATRFAFEIAFNEILGESRMEQYHRSTMPVAKLLPSDQSIYEALLHGLDVGFSIFKMKIGLRDFNAEFEVVKNVISHFRGAETLRIDANEGLSVDLARKWLASLETFPVEFLEQPLKRHQIDEMIELSGEFSTNVALDESIATTRDLIDCYNKGFRGIFSVKPLRLAELGKFLDWRVRTDARISYSTIFETAIGATFGIQLAASDKRNTFGLGFGVGHMIKETGLVLPSRPNYSIIEILQVDKEKIWESLA